MSNEYETPVPLITHHSLLLTPITHHSSLRVYNPGPPCARPVVMPEVKEQTAATIDDAACAPEWKDILQQMILIRPFEEPTEREFLPGKIDGYLHLYSGQKATA